MHKAFLKMILKSEVGKNRFCFFFCFFFLLEMVKMCAFDTQHLFLDLWLVHLFKIFFIQFLLNKYKGNECAGDLKNKFNVDNLLVTSENTSVSEYL